MNDYVRLKYEEARKALDDALVDVQDLLDIIEKERNQIKGEYIYLIRRKSDNWSSLWTEIEFNNWLSEQNPEHFSEFAIERWRLFGTNISKEMSWQFYPEEWK